MKIFWGIFLFCTLSTFAQDNWMHHQLPESVSMRGIAAWNQQNCWVSGSAGSVYRTADGGRTWRDVSPEGFDSLDFRDIELLDSGTALIMSSGFPTHILKTTNGGREWFRVYSSYDPKVFLNAMDFWDDGCGMAFGDAIDGELFILTSRDAGESWVRIKPSFVPGVDAEQGGFAASGSCLLALGDSVVLIGIGVTDAVILRTDDRGASWKKITTPLSAGISSSGIFGFGFLDDRYGLCVGGDYRADSLSVNSVAVTEDGGLHWQLIDDEAVNGYYHSASLVLSRDTMLCISRFGSSWSYDGGRSWERSEIKYFSISKFEGGFWASGPDGRVGRWLAQ